MENFVISNETTRKEVVKLLMWEIGKIIAILKATDRTV
jgi:hypothetical protein